MTDKHIFYDYEGQTLKIPVEEQKEFEKNVPSAKMLLTYEGNNLSVPVSELKGFIKDVGKENVSYSVYNDKNEYQPEKSVDKYSSYDKPSIVESLAKGGASSVVGAAGGLFDKMLQGISGFQYYHPLTNQTVKAEEFYDKEMQNPNSDIAKASKAIRETAERLSRESDPTGGEVGFVDLIKDGKFGTAMQKGLATMAESSVQTLSAANPYLATLNFLSMWGRNYAEQVEENPDIPRWKRNAYAIGNAAIEQAVEKYADPIFKYVGGKKVAGELTEEIAKEIIEKATKDGVQTLTNRIVRLLSNTGKDMLSEGTEEIITSGGGDILGGVLDAISGDKEYGIKAQWEEYKKSNPNATKAEFARDKSKEYIDAFIGGAISAGYMSGTAQTFKESRQAKAINNVEKSREAGSTLDLNNMYDVNDKVNKVIENTSKAFANETDKPSISADFFANLSSYEAFALSESDDITMEQKVALESLANAKAMQEGLDAKLDNRINDFINKQTAIVNEATEDGSVVIGNYNGTGVFVKGGVIENGAITLPDGSNGPVIVINMTTGEKTTVQSNEIVGASSFSSDEYVNGMSQNYRDMDGKAREEARNTMSPMAKLVAVQPYVGKKILVDLGNGIVEVYVQQITDNGEVTLKGKKGDLGGQSIVTLNSGTFYDSIHRDDTGNPVITEVKESEAEELNKKEEEPVSEPVKPESTNAGPVDYREQVVTILINGKPVQVEVTGQDNTSDSITYEYTDENGNRRSGGSSIAEFESAITTPVETEPEVEPELPVEEPVSEVEPEAPTEVPITPEVINWDALLDNEPEAYFAEMQKRFGNKTANRINAVITVLQKEIDSLNKANPKTQEEIFENEDRKEALQAKIDSLNGMIERLNAPAKTETEVTAEPVSETPVEEAPVAEAEPVVEHTPVEEHPVADEPVSEVPVTEQTLEPAAETVSAVPVAPTPVSNQVAAALKREESLRKQLERRDIDKNQRSDMAYNAGKAIANMFATREEYEAYEEVASDLGEFYDDFERGVNDSFANRKGNQNAGKSDGNSVYLGIEPKTEQDGKQTEQAQGEDTIRQGDDAVGGRSVDGGTETADTGNTETEQELGKGESVEEVKKEYPVRKGNATRKLLEDTFGFAKVSIPNTESKVLNTVYDFMMEMAKMLGISPNVIGNGGWLDVANLRSTANADASYVWKNRSDGTVVEPRLKLKYGRISSIAHEWWHSLDHVLKYFNTGKGNSTATKKINLLESFGVRKEVREALTAILKSMKDSGFESRISSMKLPLSYKFYLLKNEEMTARAFDAYINDKFAEAGIEVENAVYERTPYQPTPEEMEVIAPAFDNLFSVLKEKEGIKAGTSVLYHISKEMNENSEAKRELGELVSEWIKMGGNFVVMDSTEMQQALEKEGLVQSAKRPRRSILNRHLTSSEKQRIQKYILSLPMSDVRDRPYMLMTRNYAYIFNTFRALYEENTTQHPVGDGFEILHKVSIRGLSAEQKKELQRNYEYDADRENINGWLQTSGALFRGLPVSVSDSSNTTTGVGYDSVAEGEYREETRADGFDNSSLRNTGEVQKLETPDGIIYGFVKDGVVYLDPSLLNPNTAIHEYTHLWDNALMQFNRPLWERGKALMKQLSIWNEVINDPNYSKIKDNEDLVASEVHSRLVGKSGEDILNQLEQEARSESITKGAKKLNLLGQIREWLNEATKWLKDAFKAWTDAELDALTLDDFLNMPMRDLVNFTSLPRSESQETQYSIIPNGELKTRLQEEIDNGEYITLYRAVRKINGKYYSPKMSKLGGVGQEIVLGQLEQSDERPDLAYPVQMKDGTIKYKVNLDGSDPSGSGLKSRTTAGVDYNPYIHASDSMMNDQFTAAFAMPEMTVIEVRVPKSELTSGYHAQYAADHVGLTPWKSGTVDLKLPKNEQRNVYLSRYDMPVREVSTEEIADHIAAKLLRNGLSMPYNLVTPQVAEALLRRGVDVSEKPSGTVPSGQNEVFIQLKERVLSEQNQEVISSSLENMVLDPDTVAQESARQAYDKSVNNVWQEFQRQFQDAYQPVRIALDAIQQETGNIPIEDYENYLLIQNQSSSRSRVEIDTFSRRFYSPIIDKTNKIIDKILIYRNLDIKDKDNRAAVYKEVLHYLIAKHGLERNKYYQSTKTRKMTPAEQKPLLDEAERAYNEKVNEINSNTSLSDAERELNLRDALDAYNAEVIIIKNTDVPDMRDYSGLTALFGLDSKEFEEAERMAEEEIERFEAIVSTDTLWSKINAATNRTLKHSYESGLLSRKQYEDISSMFKFYIPLRGFDENTAEDVYSYARFEGNHFNPAVQTAKGRTSLADDPIATIMNMAESEIAQGNKNRAKQALYYYLLNRPVVDENGNQRQNSLMQIESVWYVVGTDENGNDVYQIAAPDHDKGETYEEFENRMAALAGENKAFKSKKGGVDVGMRFQRQTHKNAHYVYLKINGVEKAIYINGDPKAADAINGTYKQKPLPKATIKIGDREITVDIPAIQRNISATFTNYSLEFTARNYFRDLIYSHINIDIRESDPAYRKKFRQNWRSNNLRTMIQMLKAYRAGEYDSRPLNEDEAAFVEFMENGGQTGYTIINSVEARKKELENAIKRMQDGVEKGGLKDSTIFKATLGGIELLNEASELVTRFAAYKTSRDMGRSVVKSISDANEVTVNFNTKGAQDGSGLWGRIAKYFGWSKYFFNASVQGVQNITAMAKADKLKFGATVGSIVATGFMMPVIISAISSMLGGEDDEEEYWNIPEYDRQNNFCIPLGNGKYAKIPLPIGFREMYAIGDMVAAMAFDKKFTRDSQQIGLDIANKIASILLPINPLESSANGLSIWASIGNFVLPSSTQFITQNWTNMDWKGAPLQKEYTYNENDPQWMKAYASNPLWMKSLSKWCNENIGAGDLKGWDWSPEKLDNTLSNLFGGVYSLIKKTGRGVTTIWNGITDEKPFFDVVKETASAAPLTNVAFGSGIDSDERFITDAYYDMLEYYNDRIGVIKRRAEKFGYDLDDVFLKKKGKHHPKMLEIYNNDTFDFMQEWYKGNEELKELHKKVKDIEKKIAEKENPSEALVQKLLKAQAKLENERREFVNDMLELD